MKYEVTLYYNGSICTEVEANNKQEALEMARLEAMQMDDTEFIGAAGIMEIDHDVVNIDGNIKGTDPIDESKIKGDDEASISSIKGILNLIRDNRNLVFEITDEDAENVLRLQAEKKCGICEACYIILDKIVETIF